jgi:hypothetical protein
VAEEGATSVGWVPGRAGRGCLLCVWISRASIEWTGRARHDFGCISGHLGARRRLLLVHESSGTEYAKSDSPAPVTGRAENVTWESFLLYDKLCPWTSLRKALVSQWSVESTAILAVDIHRVRTTLGKEKIGLGFRMVGIQYFSLKRCSEICSDSGEHQ